MADNDYPGLQQLIQQLKDLRSEMLNLEAANLADMAQVHPENHFSVRNLLHYLALRKHDIRQLQEQLAGLGLSSLGRTESHVLSAVCAVLSALRRLSGADEPPVPGEQACEIGEGRRLLERNTEALLGATPDERRVRIMVTMPPEAATDYELVRSLLLSGMNCMRVNCAHDGEEAWSGMIENLRRAEQETGRQCKVHMDVAGPKLRTGPIAPGPAVAKYRPKRDAFGRVRAPARIWLTSTAHPENPPGFADVHVRVPGDWLSRLQSGDLIRFVDARGAARSLRISEVAGKSRWAESGRTAYLAPGLWLTAIGSSGQEPRRARIGPIEPQAQSIPLERGDTLILTRSLEPGRLPEYDGNHRLVRPGRIGVTLSEFFDCARQGEPVWFDDGKIGAVITSIEPDHATVEITQAREGGEKLGAGKGINAPETNLRVDPLTAEDLKALEFIAKHADIVGYSFVRTEADVRHLQSELARLNAENLGIVLKIETQQGFENLPRLILAAMRSRAVGVMIARGDLAVECGYRRLAEVQEEILWISEAAHVPVIWATQVLESLAKTGIPSRSEITDAAMGERAECVMLNKGPYIVPAVDILDDILRRMQAHQEKKSSMLRKLHVAATFS